MKKRYNILSGNKLKILNKLKMNKKTKRKQKISSVKSFVNNCMLFCILLLLLLVSFALVADISFANPPEGGPSEQEPPPETTEPDPEEAFESADKLKDALAEMPSDAERIAFLMGPAKDKLKENWDDEKFAAVLTDNLKNEIYEDQIGSEADSFIMERFVEEKGLGQVDFSDGDVKFDSSRGVLSNGDCPQNCFNLKQGSDHGLDDVKLKSVRPTGFVIERKPRIPGEEDETLTITREDGVDIILPPPPPSVPGEEPQKATIDADGNIKISEGMTVDFGNGNIVNADGDVTITKTDDSLTVKGPAQGTYSRAEFTTRTGELSMTRDRLGNIDFTSDDATLSTTLGYFDGHVEKQGDEITLLPLASTEDPEKKDNTRKTVFVDRDSGVGIKTNGYPVDVHRDQVYPPPKDSAGNQRTDDELRNIAENAVETSANSERGQVWFKEDDTGKLNIFATGPVDIDRSVKDFAVGQQPQIIQDDLHYSSSSLKGKFNFQEYSEVIAGKTEHHLIVTVDRAETNEETGGDVVFSYPSQQLEFQTATNSGPEVALYYEKTDESVNGGTVNEQVVWNAKGEFKFEDDSNVVTTSHPAADLEYTRIGEQDTLTANKPPNLGVDDKGNPIPFVEISRKTDIIGRSDIELSPSLHEGQITYTLAGTDKGLGVFMDLESLGTMKQQLDSLDNSALVFTNHLVVKSSDGKVFFGINENGMMRYENGQTGEASTILSPMDAKKFMGLNTIKVSPEEDKLLRDVINNWNTRITGTPEDVTKAYQDLSKIPFELLQANPALRAQIEQSLKIDVSKINDPGYLQEIRKSDEILRREKNKLDQPGGANYWMERLQEKGVLDENGNLIPGSYTKGDSKHQEYLSYQIALMKTEINIVGSDRILLAASDKSTDHLSADISQLEKKISKFEL
ncbi:hypothetical protein ACFL0W_06680, partial [Nanoarchaeota archaeon]